MVDLQIATQVRQVFYKTYDSWTNVPPYFRHSQLPGHMLARNKSLELCFGGKVPLAGYLRPVKEGMSPIDLMNDEFHSNIMKMLKKQLFPLNSHRDKEKKYFTYQREKSKFKKKQKKRFMSSAQN